MGREELSIKMGGRTHELILVVVPM